MLKKASRVHSVALRDPSFSLMLQKEENTLKILKCFKIYLSEIQK